MIISQEQLNLIEFTTMIYKEYIDFDKYSLKMVDYYIQEMFKKSYTKQECQVLVLIPTNITKECSKVFIDNDNIVKFFDSSNSLLLSTYSQCLEDIVGMNKIKAFIFD